MLSTWVSVNIDSGPVTAKSLVRGLIGQHRCQPSCSNTTTSEKLSLLKYQFDSFFFVVGRVVVLGQ